MKSGVMEEIFPYRSHTNRHITKGQFTLTQKVKEVIPGRP